MNEHFMPLDARTLARVLGGEAGTANGSPCVRAPGPGHSSKDRSMTVFLDPSAPAGFRTDSKAGDDWAACRDYINQKLGRPAWSPAPKETTADIIGRMRPRAKSLDLNTAKKQCAKDLAGAEERRRIVATYGYTDENGALLFQSVRYQPKGFRQRRPDPDKPNEWIWNMQGVRRVPYRLPEVIGADTVFIVEGEKDADNLATLGLVATTCPEGAGKWKRDLNEYFEAKVVYILEDNDEAGRRHGSQVAENLHGAAAEVRVIRLPGLPEKGDVSDWLDQGGNKDRLLEIARGAPLWEPEPEKPEEPPTSDAEALPFVGFDDIEVSVEKPWVLKGVLAKGETSSWVGGPGKGKSALLTDISVHVSDKRDWRGYKAKGRFAVVYLAFERGDLLKRRLEAYKRKHGLDGLPIVVVTVPVDLMQPGSVSILVATIRAVAARYGVDVGLLVIDTYAKAIALGGGDENIAKDQNRVLGHLRLVQNQTNVHVALVGHTGKDEAKGARGSNAHLGDVDLMVQFSGSDVKTALVTKANDQPEGPLTAFKLETFDFGTDEDGDPITTSIVARDEPEEAETARGKRSLTDRQKIALDALTEALITFGRDAPGAFRLTRGLKAVEASKWRDELVARGVLDLGAANPRTDFQRVREALQGKSLVGYRDGLVWKVDQ